METPEIAKVSLPAPPVIEVVEAVPEKLNVSLAAPPIRVEVQLHHHLGTGLHLHPSRHKRKCLSVNTRVSEPEAPYTVELVTAPKVMESAPPAVSLELASE